jgi:hypothetical protein
LYTASVCPKKSQWTMASSLIVPHSESSVINWAQSYASPQCTIHSQMGLLKEQMVSSSPESRRTSQNNRRASGLMSFQK